MSLTHPGPTPDSVRQQELSLKNFKKRYDYVQPVYAVHVSVCATQKVYHWLTRVVIMHL